MKSVTVTRTPLLRGAVVTLAAFAALLCGGATAWAAPAPASPGPRCGEQYSSAIAAAWEMFTKDHRCLNNLQDLESDQNAYSYTLEMWATCNPNNKPIGSALAMDECMQNYLDTHDSYDWVGSAQPTGPALDNLKKQYGPAIGRYLVGRVGPR